MVTKEGKREGKLTGMKEFIQEGSIDVKLPRGKCEIYSNVKYMQTIGFAHWPKHLQLMKNKSGRLQDELFLEEVIPQTRTPNSQTQMSSTKTKTPLKSFSVRTYSVPRESAKMFELYLAYEYVISSWQML